MPHQVSWYSPLRALEARFEGKITASEMSLLAEAYVRYLTEAEQHAAGRMIYLLFDTSDAENLPPMYSMLTQGVSVLKFKNRGPVFHVSRSGVIRTIVEITAFVSGFQVTAYPTRELAVAALEAALAKEY